MSEAPYWAPRSRRVPHFTSDLTAAEQVWQRRYGHPELRGDEVQIAPVQETVVVAQPTVPEVIGAEAVANA